MNRTVTAVAAMPTRPVGPSAEVACATGSPRPSTGHTVLRELEFGPGRSAEVRAWQPVTRHGWCVTGNMTRPQSP
jgi:hypothetical protein